MIRIESKTVAAIGRNVAGVQGDVRKLEDLDRLYAKVASDGRKIDVVVANVGAAAPEQWRIGHPD